MKILSPYTVTSRDKKKLYIFGLIAIIIVIIFVFGYIFARNNNNDDFVDSRVSYKIGE